MQDRAAGLPDIPCIANPSGWIESLPRWAARITAAGQIRLTALRRLFEVETSQALIFRGVRARKTEADPI
jgi:hypothetical protein